MNIERIRQPFIKKFPGDFSDNPMQRNTPRFYLPPLSLPALTNLK
jgi:hypothetical protein